jgi:hypothetical protein
MVKLEDYTATELKKMISSFNKVVKFGAYSKLNKAELIKMMKSHPKIKIQEGANGVKISLVAEQETPVKEKKEKKAPAPKTQQKAQQAKVIAPVKKEPELKKALRDVINNYYDKLNDLELKVLNGKVKDESNEYEEEQKNIKEKINVKLNRVRKKYMIKADEESKFFESKGGGGVKYDPDELKYLKNDKLDIDTLPNYKKLIKTGDKIEEKKKKK